MINVPIIHHGDNLCDEMIYKIYEKLWGSEEKDEIWVMLLNDFPEDWKKDTGKIETMMIKAEVFTLGEILIVDMWGRDVGGVGRKPGKWGIINPDKEDEREYKNEHLMFKTFRFRCNAIRCARNTIGMR